MSPPTVSEAIPLQENQCLHAAPCEKLPSPSTLVDSHGGHLGSGPSTPRPGSRWMDFDELEAAEAFEPRQQNQRSETAVTAQASSGACDSNAWPEEPLDEGLDYLMQTCFFLEESEPHADHKVYADENSQHAETPSFSSKMAGMYDSLLDSLSMNRDPLHQWWRSTYQEIQHFLCEELPKSMQHLSDAGDARVLYSVRFILDDQPEVVANTLEKALLQGQPGRIDEDTKQILFAVTPIASEWIEALGTEAPLMPEAARKAHCALQHHAAYSLGLRPLAPDEECIAETSMHGWSIFHMTGDRVLFLMEKEHRDPKTGGILMIPEMKRIHSLILAREEEVATSDVGFKRVFLVIVCSALVGIHIDFSRHMGRLPEFDEPGVKDCAFVLRCTVRTTCSNEGKVRTELTREVLDQWPFVRSGLDKLTVVQAGTEHAGGWQKRDSSELMLKCLAHMVEEEGRIWIAANGFRLVEVWRGLHRNEVNFVAASKLIGVCYCLTPGEGALAACEYDLPRQYNPDSASELEAFFPTSEVHASRAIPTEHHLAEGSILIPSFAALLDRICRRAPPHANVYHKFVDLGSGEGLAVIAANQLFPFRTCLGIELVPEQVARARSRARRLPNQGIPPDDLFVNGDIFDDEYDWSDASVVFCNAATWPVEMVNRLGERALKLRRGAFFLLLKSPEPFPPCPEMFGKFVFRIEACRVTWHNRAEKVWVWQKE